MAQNAGNPISWRARATTAHMSRFTEMPLDTTGLDTSGMQSSGQRFLVEVHTTEDLNELPALVMTCLKGINEAENNYQRCAYHASVILCFFPVLLDEYKAALEDAGMTVNVVKTQAERQEAGFMLDPPQPPAAVLCYLMQSILILYKNISQRSFQNYFTKRTYAMKAKLSTDVSLRIIIHYNLSDAVAIRAMTGAQHHLKAQLLRKMIAGSSMNSGLGQVCNYVCSMLTFNEMAYMGFIVETLLRPKSPVIQDPRVQQEVSNLADAFRMVCSHPHPQYFRILASPSETRLIERARFSTLIAVAQKIKADTAPTVNQFAGGTQAASSLVTELFNLHKNYMMQVQGVINEQDNTFLTTFASEDRT